MNKKIEQLLKVKNVFQNPVNIRSRAEVLGNPFSVPNEGSIYAWYFKNLPESVPTKDCATHKDLTLLYVGISPCRAESRQNLRSRLKSHFRGNASRSTLRLTLGCLLSDQLGIELRRRGNGGRMHFGNGEQNLSDWLNENAFVTWYVCDEPWQIETEIFSQLSLPLNLRHNQHHIFHPTLSELRHTAGERAGELPIV